LLLAGPWGVARAADEEKPKARRDRIQQAVKRLEMLRKMMEENQGGLLLPEGLGLPEGFGLPLGDRLGAAGTTPHPRLGAEVQRPGAALVEQLDLPRDRGLVLMEVGPNSAAAKAGLKKHDILLELGGKAVPSKAEAFRKLLSGIKANTPVDAVVMRKGKKETVKGLTLPEAKAAAAPEPGEGLFDIPNLPDLLPKAPADGEVTSITRNYDQFTATQKKGKATVTVTGTVDQGKAKVGKVVIEDGEKGKKEYEGVDKIPAEYKQRVEKLAEMSAGGKTVPNP